MPAGRELLAAGRGRLRGREPIAMEPEVETRFGRIRGREVAGIRVFRGVRFACPPLGPLRFQPPVNPEPWTGTQA